MQLVAVRRSWHRSLPELANRPGKVFAPFDPIVEARRQWEVRWLEHADQMAAVTSVMRVRQLPLSRVEENLKRTD